MKANSLLLGGIVFGLVVTAFGDQGTIRVSPFGNFFFIQRSFIVMPKCDGGLTESHKISSFPLFFQQKRFPSVFTFIPSPVGLARIKY